MVVIRVNNTMDNDVIAGLVEMNSITTIVQSGVIGNDAIVGMREKNPNTVV